LNRFKGNKCSLFCDSDDVSDLDLIRVIDDVFINVPRTFRVIDRFADGNSHVSKDSLIA
jgi:hypothetical protein